MKIMLFIVISISYVINSYACGSSEDGKNTCIIFITHATYHGYFNNTRCTHGGCPGYKGGANAICNDEAKKYHNDLVNQGITFKALLDHNQATQIHKKYYREDGVTLIAEASGTNLRQYLDNSIIDSPQTFVIWTGLEKGVVSDKSDRKANCSAWTNTCNIAACGGTGRVGIANRTGQDTSRPWDSSDRVPCWSNTAYLACVAQ